MTVNTQIRSKTLRDDPVDTVRGLQHSGKHRLLPRPDGAARKDHLVSAASFAPSA